MEIQQLKEQIDQLNHELHTMRQGLEAETVHKKLDHLKDEMANAVTHALGVVFFIVAIPVLMAYCVRYSTFDYTICAAIFGFSLLTAYLSSTLYHSFHHTETKRILRIFDHISIFLLIGGSYTPVVYHYMPHDFAIKFLVMLWAIIAVGCVLETMYIGRFRLLSTMIYLALGFMVLFIIRPLTASMDALTIGLLIAGGVSYTLGVPFYILKKIKYNHAIWHLFVFGGSVLHYFVVLRSAT